MKINKKATLCTAGVLAIGALAATLGTMSYFTDTDSKTNVFTVGNVDITLNEKQRAIDQTTGCKDPNEDNLVDFTAQVVYPIATSAQAKKDAMAMPVDCLENATIDLGRAAIGRNYVDKMVSVTNDGASDAWVRVYYAVPTALIDSDPTDSNQFNDILHLNEGTFPSAGETRGYYWAPVYPYPESGTVSSEVEHGATWLLGPVENDKVTSFYHYQTTIDNVSYEVFYQDIISPLPAGEESQRVLNGFYLDAGTTIETVTTAAGEEQHLFDKNGNDTGWKANDPINIPVYAVAVQDKGFDSTAEAVSAAFGANFDPFNAN